MEESKVNESNNGGSLFAISTVKLANDILEEAIALGASDIHFEPFKDVAIIRLRIDGILKKIMDLPRKQYPNLVSRIKVMSSMDIIERRIPQDGKFDYVLNEKSYNFRVSSMPVVHGEKLVIRILYKSMSIASLEKLFLDDALKSIKELIKSSNGIILVTGPTGSGKSTTMYAILNELNYKEKNIITIEDPVEYQIKGINQINVNNKTGLTFARGLRSILRQDPDIIMVGEIRDEETAKIAVSAAITGHLVISTLHTNDSFSAPLRLADMGVPRYMVSNALKGVLAQRLVRVLCPKCKEEYKVSSNEAKATDLKGNSRIYRAKGCTECNFTGYSGRTIVNEIFKVNSEIREIILNSENSNILREHCIMGNMILLRDSCFRLIKDGITTLEEYDRLSLEEFCWKGEV